MANQGKTLQSFGVDATPIREEFSKLIAGKPHLSDLQYIFDFAISNMEYFPKIILSGSATYKDYLARWVKNYEEAISKLPSKKTAQPKGSCSDPAVKIIVQTVTAVDDNKAEEQNKYHNLFMSAENIQGGLLEEYIYKNVGKFGWIWCAGNTLQAIDFITKDGKKLLQIKNKSNTENSSSNKVRENTPIEKLYRLGTKTVKGEKHPKYKWDDLNKVINSHKGSVQEDCAMSEEGYIEFLKKVASSNKHIISDK